MDDYEVILRPAAQRDLRKIAEPFYGRILTALSSLKEQPRPKGVRKLAGYDNEWRLRVGDYRFFMKSTTLNGSFASFRLLIVVKHIVKL
jgi:mRNA interferase RelE/StbE